MVDKPSEHPPFLMRTAMWFAQPFMEVGSGFSYLHNLLSHPGSIASAACLVLGLLVGGCTIYTGGKVVVPSPRITLPATLAAQPGRLTEIDAVTNGSSIIWETTATDYDVVTSTTLPKAAFVFPVKGQYLVTARVAIGSKIATSQCQVTVGDVPPGPGPGPDPVPPVPPGPPAPIPEPGFRVLIVLNTADLSKLPPAQAIAIQSKDVTDYLNSKCVVGTDGKQKEWRIWDSSVDPSTDSPIWQAAFKRPRGTLPSILISNGKTGFEGPLPVDTASLLALLKKYGE